MYASRRQFCRIFHEEMAAFYLLSFLLTGNPEQAEQCFISALQNCLEGPPVFSDRARAWSRRAIVRNAIRLGLSGDGLHKVTPICDMAVGFRIDGRLSAVAQLQPLQRFAFVLTVLERYSDRECSALLNCARMKVASARASALEHLVAAYQNTEVDSEVLGQLAATAGMKQAG